ncbi:5-oxoprolinase subunit PxpA [Pseudohaliea rubra]|uniref:Lactam utilization protein LamB n=1 Tax=Pseudohaliea rubra DSM 19751 TaxID=1265313 RepID=A0A095X1Z4_9GAMM|nr:5-oxoprolinase subunit PxpA [Pseudohaliea rubra]KGE04904.1 Lactam utilization protein LamB [Pseudohaliea rubra DSM 19751]
MLLNCDLGESYGSWRMGMDAHVMPHIDLANIACGFHGGDPLTLAETLALAREHGVAVGAHPAYPDLVGFGRRSMNLSREELIATLRYQIAALEGMAACAGIALDYVKPHGALYNDMMRDATIRDVVMTALAGFHRPLKLMLLATAAADAHREEATRHGIDLLFEAFADRRYDDNGHLLSRSESGAVHNRERMLEQVESLLQDRAVTTARGQRLTLEADTLCVHGDNEEGVRAIEAIRERVGKRRARA